MMYYNVFVFAVFLVSLCVCVFFPFILDIKFVGRTSRGQQQQQQHRRKVTHTAFFIHLLSAVRALIFLARRIQPFLTPVDREVEFLCTNDLIVFHPSGILFFIYFYFLFLFSEKHPQGLPGSNSRPNLSE